MINVELEKTGSESNANLLRRFTKRVQASKVLNTARANRYAERSLSHFKVKAKTLESLKRKKTIQKLIKLGKITPKKFTQR